MAPQPVGHIVDQLKQYTASRAAVEVEYGSVDQAVCALGADIAARGEQHAQLTAEEVFNRWDQRMQTAAAEHEDTQTFDSARHAADVALAVDEDTKADLQTLADGYRTALGEVRQLGGQLNWHERSQPAAVKAFNEAANLFPADWIDASNKNLSAQLSAPYRVAEEGTPDSAPVAKVARSRAHYAHKTLQRVRKKKLEESAHHRSMWQDSYDPQTGRSTDPRVEYRPLTDDEFDANSTIASWERGDYLHTTRYEVHRPSPFADTDSNHKPRGAGWEQWTHPHNPEDMRWRRPRYRMALQDVHVAAEITANRDSHSLPGRSDTYATCAHELSHRFEYTVFGLTGLETEFRNRRATDPRTGQLEQPVRLYPSARGSARQEIALADDFPLAYTGKVYPEDQATEVLSTGVEGLFGGQFGGFNGIGVNRTTLQSRWDADPELRNFVLGALASTNRSDRP